MDVQPGRRIAVLGILDPVELGAVAGFLGMFELAPLRGGVETGGGDLEPLGGGVLDQCRADRRERLRRVVE